MRNLRTKWTAKSAVISKDWLLIIGLSSSPACSSLLDADFDDLPEGNLFDETVNLPGPPNGDRMLIENLASITDIAGTGDHTLNVFRNAIVSREGNHSEAYFDPVDANGEGSIFFAWSGEIFGLSVPDADPPVVALKLRDLVGPDQPNLFSKLIIRLGPEKITVAIPPDDEVSIGNGVTGSHGVILRIDPGAKTYSFLMNGDGVSPGDSVTHDGAFPAEETIDPSNIGLTITFADEINAGGNTYVVDDMLVSEREP